MTDIPSTSNAFRVRKSNEEIVFCTDYDEIIDDSDLDPDCVEESNHSSDSEQSDDDARKVSQTQRQNVYVGKTGFQWDKQPPPQNTRTHHNIVIQLPGLKSKAEALGDNPDPEKIWSRLICEEILQEIIMWTNIKIRTARLQYMEVKNSSFTHDLDIIELKSFLGLLLLTFIIKSNDENVNCLFSTDATGRDIFRCNMSKKRLFIISC